MKFVKRPIGLLFALIACSAILHGQSFDTTIGGSQTYSAYGLQTEFKWRNLSGWTGLGFNDGVKVGAFVTVPLARGYQLGGGDQMLSGYLDVDEYDSHAFSVRGISLTRETKTESFQIFTGFLSQDSEYPFLHMSTTSGNGLSQTRLIAMLYKHKLSETLRMHALTLYGTHFTSIESVSWTPSKRWALAGAAGVGSGSLYLAGKSEMHFKWVDSNVSYARAGPSFHRQEQPNYSSEQIGLNVRLVLTPTPSVKLTLDHEKSRMYLALLPSVVGSFDSARLNASLMGFQISPSVGTVSASNLPGRTMTEMISVSRTILPRWRAFGAYINMKSPNFTQSTIVTTNEVKVSPRLAIRQNYNRMNGQNNFSFGAQWLSNRLSFSVDQQVYISPLAPAFGARSVFQAWTFNVRLRTPHGTSTNLNTFITPDGRMQWGGYLSGMRYHAVTPATDGSPSFSKYLVSGLVVDETGKGVWGVAVQIGSETVISDSNGGFFLHVKNSKPQPVLIVPDSSLQTSRWALTSAPPTAQGFKEDAAGNPVRVVVQMGRRAIVHNLENTKTIEPQSESSTTSSSVEPHDLQKTMQPEVRPVAAEPQVETNTISSNIPPRGPQVAMVLSAQDPENIQTNTSGREEEELSAANQLHDPQIARHFAIEQSPAIVVYNPAHRAGEPPASKEASPLQQADRTLKPSSAKGFQNQPEQQRPKKHNSFLHAIGGYLFAVNEPNPKKS